MKEEIIQSVLQNLCLSSYAYRYSTAIKDDKNRMSVTGFMRRAADLGFRSVLLCENVRKPKWSDDQLRAICETAAEQNLSIELGSNSLSHETLKRDIELAEITKSNSLRLVIGDSFLEKYDSKVEQIDAVKKELFRVEKDLKRAGIRLGIENHFDFTTEELVSIVNNFDKDVVGYIFDTSNCLGFLEKPEEALFQMNGRIYSVHLKDFTITKRHKTEYVIFGTTIGQGKLDVRGILTSLIDKNPGVVIVLELSIPKPHKDMKIANLVAWEDSIVIENYRLLKKAIEDL